MPDRRRQILQLWGSRHDQLWFPNGSLKTSSGLAPNERIDCPTCGQSDTPGWLLDRFKRRTPCLTCGGRLATDTRREKRGTGRVFIDRMDTLRLPVGHHETRASSETAARPGRMVTCDRCAGDGVWKTVRCDLCDGTGRRPLHVFDLRLDMQESDGPPSPGDGLAAGIDRRNQAGSYAELDHAVDVLGLGRGQRFLLDQAAVGDAEPVGLVLRSLLDRIDVLMPDPIVVPAGVTANARLRREQLRKVKGRGMAPQSIAARNREIVLAVEKGRPSSWVAREHGLSVASINRIVKGEVA